MASQTVFLVGFMGSGKTTYGKKLAHKLNLTFCDLDAELCRKFETPSVKVYIEEHGLDAFREAETATLQSLAIENKLVATGGGTPCYFNNMQWMKSKGTVVFLEVSEGILYSRLREEEQHARPLLKNLDEAGLKNFIHAKLEERLPVYRQAHITFNPVSEKMEGLIEQIQNIQSKSG